MGGEDKLLLPVERMSERRRQGGRRPNSSLPEEKE